MSPKVLIVEDEGVVAMEVEQALISAGYEVCGVAASEAEAIALAEQHRPALAVVDISLDPGDGRNVALELSRRYGTAVLFATSQCDEVAQKETGAAGCLPKPFKPEDVAPALVAAAKIASGHKPAALPDDMIALK